MITAEINIGYELSLMVPVRRVNNMQRKITQIAISNVKNTFRTQCDYIVIALCNDGSIWEAPDGVSWQRLPDIPARETMEPQPLWEQAG